MSYIKKSTIVSKLRNDGLNISAGDIEHADKQLRLGYTDTLSKAETFAWVRVIKEIVERGNNEKNM